MGLGLETRNACENGSKCRRVKSDARQKRLLVKTLFPIFIYHAFAAKGCVNYARPNTVLLWRKADVYCSRNPPRNAEDNLRAEHVVIEDTFRGYRGSHGLWSPQASGLLDMGRTDGLSRYKENDHYLCPVRTPVCVNDKFRCPDILFPFR